MTFEIWQNTSLTKDHVHITAIYWGTQRQYLKNTSVKKLNHLKHVVAAAQDFNILGRGGKTGSHILPVCHFPRFYPEIYHDFFTKQFSLCRGRPCFTSMGISRPGILHNIHNPTNLMGA